MIGFTRAASDSLITQSLISSSRSMSSNMLRSRSSSLLPVTNSIGKSDSFTFNGNSLRRGKKGGASPLLRFLVLIVFAGVLIGAGFVIARYGPNATILYASTKDLSASSVGGLTATEEAYMEARVEKRRRYGGTRKEPKGGDDSSNNNNNRTDNISSNGGGGGGGASIDAEDTRLKEQFALDAAAKAEAVRLEQQQAQQAAAVQLQQQQQQLEAEAQQQLQLQQVPEPVQQQEHDDHQAAAAIQQHTEQQLDPQHQVVPTPTFATLYEDTMGAVDIHGNLVHFSDLRGHVTLVVNVASQCGYTDTNYQGLQQIYERYHDYGLEILAFPSNQFNNQEPGTEAEIEEFVRGRYGAAFPLMSKVDVNGAAEHPVFNFLKKYTPPLPNHPAEEPVSWNFNKFLLDKWGRPIKRYESEMDYHMLETDVYNMLIQPYP